jgi:hypothetical protein
MNLFLRIASLPFPLLVALLAQPPRPAWAVTCPIQCGSCGCFHVNCSCGQELIYNYKLTGNIGPCNSSHGLVVKADNITINGDGYRVFRTPPTNAADVYGVLLSNYDNVTVKNLEVEGFRRGIHVSSAQGTKLINIKSHGNSATIGQEPYGIDITNQAVGTVIQDDPSQSTTIPISCEIYDNGDEGIHLGGDSSHTTIDGCNVHDNAAENVYLENTFRNTVRNVHTSGGSLQLEIDDSRFNRFYGNTFGAVDEPGAAVLFAGDAHDNDFGFECHGANTVNGRINIVANDVGKAPYANNVRNTAVTANNNACVVFNLGDGDLLPSGNSVENNPALLECGTFAVNSNRSNASGTPLYDPPPVGGPVKNQVCGNNQNNFPSTTSNYIAACTPRPCNCGTGLEALCAHQGALSFTGSEGSVWWAYRGSGTNGGASGYVLLSQSGYHYGWSDFRFVFLGLGLVALQSVATCEYWTVAGTPGTTIFATASAIGPGETFTVINNGDGTHSFRAPDGSYVIGNLGFVGYGGTSDVAMRFKIHCDV